MWNPGLRRNGIARQQGVLLAIPRSIPIGDHDHDPTDWGSAECSARGLRLSRFLGVLAAWFSMENLHTKGAKWKSECRSAVSPPTQRM